MIKIALMLLVLTNSFIIPQGIDDHIDNKINNEDLIVLAKIKQRKVESYEKVTKKPAKVTETAKEDHTEATHKAKHKHPNVYLLARIINAEATGEPLPGMVAVGDVVLNRVESSQFPDTIKEVVYQPGQFSPVKNGSINKEPSERAIKAAKLALKAGGSNALYFYNPAITNDSWIRTRPAIKIIGNHVFAK